MAYPRKLSDSKSPQVSRTLLTILADLNNAVIWMIPASPTISNSSGSITNPLDIVPSTPITFGITVTLAFHNLFSYSYHSTLFSHKRRLMVSHRSLRDSKSLQVSRTFLSILADLNNAVVVMVSTRSFIFKSSSSFANSKCE